MLRIRLRRVGKKGKPSYRIVVAEATAPRDGAYVEWIGNYDPLVNPPSFSIKSDRAQEWIRQGAQPTDAVRRILAWSGVVDGEGVAAAESESVDNPTESSEPDGQEEPAEVSSTSGDGETSST